MFLDKCFHEATTAVDFSPVPRLEKTWAVDPRRSIRASTVYLDAYGIQQLLITGLVTPLPVSQSDVALQSLLQL